MNLFFWGAVGGILVEVSGLFKLRHKGCPAYLRSWFFWCISIAMALCGGLLAVAYSSQVTNMSIILALNIGASAPLILERAGKQIPKSDAIED